MSPAAILPLPSELEASLHLQEDADTKEWFNFHKAEEETISLWPLHDDPHLICFKPKKNSEVEECDPKWNEDPSKFSLLWRRDCDLPLNIDGPQIQTNLWGRSAAEVFADFPVHYDSPSSSPSLSPPSLPWSTLDISDEDMSPPSGASSDPSIDEVAEQFSERMILLPVRSPLPLSAPDLPYIDEENPMLSLCNPVQSLDSPSEASSSTSCTLSVATSSTCAVSPTVTGWSGGTSPPPDEKTRSPRSPRAPATAFHVVELDEYIDPHPRKRKLGAGEKEKKKYPCPIPGCTDMFTRRNDATRHAKTAAAHRGTAEQAQLAGDAGDELCQYCGEKLSRGDSARRHENTESCHKRTNTIRRKSTHGTA